MSSISPESSASSKKFDHPVADSVSRVHPSDRIGCLLVQQRILESFHSSLGGCSYLRKEPVPVEVQRIVQDRCGQDIGISRKIIKNVIKEIRAEIDVLSRPSGKKHPREGLLADGTALARARVYQSIDESEDREPEFHAISPLHLKPESVRDQIPTVQALIDAFSKRPLANIIITMKAFEKEPQTVLGLKATPEETLKDESRFVEILSAYNEQFQSYADAVRDIDGAGLIERVLLPDTTPIFVRADLHSDVCVLLAQLTMLRAQGYLDEEYKCVGTFQMIFLGDYADRGGNDIEVLSLLLKLRMENPQNVHLIQGNHEEVSVHQDFSDKREFFTLHQEALTRCYDSLPMAICVASQTKYRKKNGDLERQYVHFSHGLFSPAVNLGPFLQNEASPQILVLPKGLRFPSRVVLSSTKAQRAFSRLQSSVFDPEEMGSAIGYLWNDIGDTTGVVPGRAVQFSPDSIHDYFRWTAVQGAKIVAIFRGHQHNFREYTVSKKDVTQLKVIATTLPVGTSGNLFALSFAQQPLQGLLLTVQSKGSEWTKRSATLEFDQETNKPVMTVQQTSSKLYEPVRR